MPFSVSTSPSQSRCRRHVLAFSHPFYILIMFISELTHSQESTKSSRAVRVVMGKKNKQCRCQELNLDHILASHGAQISIALLRVAVQWF